MGKLTSFERVLFCVFSGDGLRMKHINALVRALLLVICLLIASCGGDRHYETKARAVLLKTREAYMEVPVQIENRSKGAISAAKTGQITPADFGKQMKGIVDAAIEEAIQSGKAIRLAKSYRVRVTGYFDEKGNPTRPHSSGNMNFAADGNPLWVEVVMDDPDAPVKSGFIEGNDFVTSPF